MNKYDTVAEVFQRRRASDPPRPPEDSRRLYEILQRRERGEIVSECPICLGAGTPTCCTECGTKGEEWPTYEALILATMHALPARSPNLLTIASHAGVELRKEPYRTEFSRAVEALAAAGYISPRDKHSGQFTLKQRMPK